MITKNVLIVCGGLPASGKSTYSEMLVSSGHFHRICPDLIRKELYGNENIQGDGKKVFSIAHERIKNFGEMKRNVVFDATNIDRRTRKNLVEQMRPYFDVIIFKWFSTPIELCLKRNERRERQVPPRVIWSMADRFQPPIIEEGWDYVEEIKNY
jgi:predicted kinase